MLEDPVTPVEAGDCIHQRPGVVHFLFDYSPDMAYLEAAWPTYFRVGGRISRLGSAGSVLLAAAKGHGHCRPGTRYPHVGASGNDRAVIGEMPLTLQGRLLRMEKMAPLPVLEAMKREHTSADE